MNSEGQTATTLDQFLDPDSIRLLEEDAMSDDRCAIMKSSILHAMDSHRFAKQAESFAKQVRKASSSEDEKTKAYRAEYAASMAASATRNTFKSLIGYMLAGFKGSLEGIETMNVYHIFTLEKSGDGKWLVRSFAGFSLSQLDAELAESLEEIIKEVLSEGGL